MKEKRRIPPLPKKNAIENGLMHIDALLHI